MEKSLAQDDNWEQHVKEGKAIVAKLSESEIRTAEWRLALGEKAEEVEPKGSNMGRPKVGTTVSTLEAYAVAIGFNTETLRQYRDVAVAVRNVDTTGMSWAAIRQLASVKGDKQTVLDEIKTAKPNKESISRNDILEHQGRPKADGVKNTPNVKNSQELYEDDDSICDDGGCPTPKLDLFTFESAIFPSLEFWPWFTRGFRPSIVKQLIASDNRPKEFSVKKDDIIDALVEIQKTLNEYIKELRKEL